MEATRWLRVTAVCAIAGAGAVRPGPILVRDGVAAARIVIPAAPGETTQRAAAELVTYVKAVSGAELGVGDVSAVPPATLPLRVGCRDGLPAEDTAFLAAQPEGFVIRVAETGISICGGTERGTRFGVYRFLEQHLGCRWLAPKLDFVPTRATLELTPGRLASAPAFEHRFFAGTRAEREAWGLKMGLNGYYSATAASANGQCYYLPAELPGCHTYNRVIPPGTYFQTHPEWFPLVNGRRQPNTELNGQLCVTADGLAEEFARNIEAIFDRDPNCRLTSISPNDGYGWCECERCLKLDQGLCGGRSTRQGLAGDKPFMGDRVFWFANEVARRVAVKYPDRLLLVLAYVNYAEPPDTVKPGPNVVPYLCHYAPADYAHAIEDAASAPNQLFDALLRRWAHTAPNLLIYSYVSKSMWWRLPRPVVRNFAADIRHYYALGIHRYYCQSGLSDWALDGPLYYVIARLLWEPTADPQALAHDWTRHMFGAAAPAVGEFYAAVEESVRATGRPYSDSPPRQVPGLYATPALDRASAALERAANLVDSDTVRERVQAVSDTFRYGRHLIRTLEAANRYRVEGDVDAALTSKKEGELALALSRHPDVVRFLDSLKLDLDLGVLTHGFGPQETRGGRSCWNTDETGVGDGKAGWATAVVRSPDTGRVLTVTMDVWGESALDTIVVNTDGLNRSSAEGGVWTAVKPEVPLSGKPEWERLVFRVPPTAMAPGRPSQRLGLGGGDSQIWISRIGVE